MANLCKECISGVRHEGTPEGTFETIKGVRCYIATPPTGLDYANQDKAILFLTDVFGQALPNNLLLADDFARNGFLVILPDIFNGDPVPADALGGGSSFDRNAWGPKHGPEQTRPPIDTALAALKERGVKRVGTLGYCFGARYVFDLAFEHAVDVCVLAHPSRLNVPADLETYKETAIAPLLINSCQIDQQFPLESQAKADELLGEGRFAHGYKQLFWDGCTHGFAVRGDMNDPKVKAGKEGAFKASVEWFMKYL